MLQRLSILLAALLVATLAPIGCEDAPTINGGPTANDGWGTLVATPAAIWIEEDIHTPVTRLSEFPASVGTPLSGVSSPSRFLDHAGRLYPPLDVRVPMMPTDGGPVAIHDRFIAWIDNGRLYSYHAESPAVVLQNNAICPYQVVAPDNPEYETPEVQLQHTAAGVGLLAVEDDMGPVFGLDTSVSPPTLVRFMSMMMGEPGMMRMAMGPLTGVTEEILQFVIEGDSAWLLTPTGLIVYDVALGHVQHRVPFTSAPAGTEPHSLYLDPYWDHVRVIFRSAIGYATVTYDTAGPTGAYVPHLALRPSGFGLDGAVWRMAVSGQSVDHTAAEAPYVHQSRLHQTDGRRIFYGSYNPTVIATLPEDGHGLLSHDELSKIFTTYVRTNRLVAIDPSSGAIDERGIINVPGPIDGITLGPYREGAHLLRVAYFHDGAVHMQLIDQAGQLVDGPTVVPGIGRLLAIHDDTVRLLERETGAVWRYVYNRLSLVEPGNRCFRAIDAPLETDAADPKRPIESMIDGGPDQATSPLLLSMPGSPWATTALPISLDFVAAFATVEPANGFARDATDALWIIRGGELTPGEIVDGVVEEGMSIVIADRDLLAISIDDSAEGIRILANGLSQPGLFYRVEIDPMAGGLPTESPLDPNPAAGPALASDPVAYLYALGDRFAAGVPLPGEIAMTSDE